MGEWDAPKVGSGWSAGPDEPQAGGESALRSWRNATDGWGTAGTGARRAAAADDDEQEPAACPVPEDAGKQLSYGTPLPELLSLGQPRPPVPDLFPKSWAQVEQVMQTLPFGGGGISAVGRNLLGTARVAAGAEEAAIGGRGLLEGRSASEILAGEAELNPAGTLGAGRVWSTKARLKAAGLPTTGRIRFVPRQAYKPAVPLPRGRNNGFMDRFGNEWTKGPSRTQGQPFEWDVRLSPTGQAQLGRLSRDGSHLNVSLDGRITHR